MADKKISALTGATTPLAGSEVLPIVQGGSTVKVSVDNLTAGKSVSATSFVPTGSTVPTNGMYLDTTNSVSIANNSIKNVTIRPGGIMGLGTTPQSWYLPGDVISAQQIGANTVTMSLFGSQSHFGSNFYLKTGTGNDTYINTGVAMRYRQDGGAHVFESAPSGTADTTITFTPLTTVAANGNFTVHTNNVVIGTAGKGIVSTVGNIAITPKSGNFVDIGGDNGFTGSILVSVNQTIANEGALMVKNNSGSNQWLGWLWNASSSGDALFLQFLTEAGGTGRGSILYNRGGGVIAYNTTSDYRSKDIFGPVSDAGATLDALKVYNGKMKGADIERPMFVAHEAQEIVPYAVSGEKDAVNEDGSPKYQQMDHQILVPLLVAEIQSLRSRLATLEAK